MTVPPPSPSDGASTPSMGAAGDLVDRLKARGPSPAGSPPPWSVFPPLASRGHDEPTDPGTGFPTPEPAEGCPQFPVKGWDRYRPVGFLGGGGMGQVFQAYDPLLNRFVALKFIQSVNPRTLARFLQEAQAQARIEHPHVCKVFEVGEVQGYPFIAMQFVEGRTLRQIVDLMSLEQKALLMLKVADAVHAAHRMGILHQDLKPSNILVEKGEEGGWNPFVMDFGLAREMGPGEDPAPGSVQGTPAYMSPEQARGEPLDRRSDIFSLGATFYEFLGGAAPFPGERIQGLGRVAQGPGVLPLATLNPRVPRELDLVVMKCLEPLPDRRYDSARALAEDLGRFLDGEPVLAHRPDALYRARKWFARNRSMALALAGGFVLLGALGGTASWALLRTRTQGALAQSFQWQVDQMQSILRNAWQMPRHDIRPQRAMVRDRMEAIKEQMILEGAVAHGPGCYALGQAWLMLGDPQKANALLQHVWDEGYRTPEVAAALGESLGRLYQSRLMSLAYVRTPWRLRGPVDPKEIPQADRIRLESSLRDPALAFLKKGEASIGPGQRLYFDGLVALLDSRPVQAVRKAREMLAHAPWSFEALLLEAQGHQVLMALALDRGDLDQARASLDDMGRAVSRAEELARSSPAVYQTLTHYRFGRLDLNLRLGRASEADRTEALQAADLTLSTDPDSWVAFTHKAVIHLLWADHLQSSGQDFRREMDLAIGNAEEARRRKPDFIWAQNTLATALQTRAELGRRIRGEDVRPLMKRAIQAYEEIRQSPLLQTHALIALGGCHVGIGLFEATRGEDPTASLRQGIDCYRAAQATGPSAGCWFLEGTPWKWLGLHARWTGKDPFPDLDRGVACYHRALELEPGGAHTLGRLADLHLVRAESLLLLGQDPSADVAEALLQSGRAMAANAGSYIGPMNRGEALLLRARWKTRRGDDPGADLAEAGRALETGIALKAGDPDLLLDRALLDRECLRRSLRRGEAGGPFLARARRHIQEVLDRNPSQANGFRTLGEVCLLAAGAGGPEAGRLREEAGRAFDRAVALNANLAWEIGRIRTDP